MADPVAAEHVMEEEGDEMANDEETKALWETYFQQLSDSDGFNIDVCPNAPPDMCGVISAIKNFKMVSSFLAEVNEFSTLAIAKFNKENREHYNFVEVLKVNRGVVAGYMYFLTFEARSKRKGLKTFQACVWDGVPDVEVEFCRLKC